MLRRAALVFATAAVLCACRAGGRGQTAVRSTTDAAANAAQAAAQAAPEGAPGAASRDDGGGRLPEDPVAGRKATAQWSEHLAHEERERRLGYDRRHLREHRTILKFIDQTRVRYDRVRGPAAVQTLQQRLTPRLEEVRRQVAAIDPAGVSSNVLLDYAAILDLLSDAYPAAKLADQHGDHAPLQRVRADLLGREQVVTAWLAEAAESQDE